MFSNKQFSHHNAFDAYDCDSHNPTIAAIDLGTNSCRLLVARINVAGIRKNYFRSRPKPIAWKVIDSFAKVVRLGEGLYSHDELSLDAIARAMEALAMCRKKLDKYHIHSLRAVATEACRRATNKDILLNQAKQELSLDIEIISAEEEARLALKGCSAIFNSQIPYGIVFDIGGGSTEVILVKLKGDKRKKPGYMVQFDVIDSVSIPYGVVTTTEEMGLSTNQEKIFHMLHEKISEGLHDFVHKNNILELISNNEVQIAGSSGTVTTLTAYHLGLAQYERRLVDGIMMTYEDMLAVIERIFCLAKENQLEHSSLGFGRADYVLTGSIILKALCNTIPAKEMRIADRGVREGILIELMREVIRV